MPPELIVLSVAALVLCVALVVRRRQRPAAADAEPSPISPVTTELARSSIASDDVVIVPLPNAAPAGMAEALVLGNEQALEILDQTGLSRRAGENGPGLVPMLVRRTMAVAGVGATSRAQGGIDSGRIVALSEESMKHLEKGKPVYDNANNLLGIVRGDKGRIQHVVRFDRAGAQAVVASNAATLAVTAALSAQLESIEHQLAEISETLQGLVADQDRARLASMVAVNDTLLSIARDVRRRGMTETDIDRLHHVELPASSGQLEAEFKFHEILEPEDITLTRKDRVDLYEDLVEKERLEYWFAYRVQAELARTRYDLLRLLWEQQEHPATAPALAREVQATIAARQRRMREVGLALEELTDPASRTRLDPLRQISRLRLGGKHETVEALLAEHESLFAGPESDPLAVSLSALEPGSSELPIRELGTGPLPRE